MQINSIVLRQLYIFKVIRNLNLICVRFNEKENSFKTVEHKN